MVVSLLSVIAVATSILAIVRQDVPLALFAHAILILIGHFRGPSGPAPQSVASAVAPYVSTVVLDPTSAGPATPTVPSPPGPDVDAAADLGGGEFTPYSGFDPVAFAAVEEFIDALDGQGQ